MVVGLPNFCGARLTEARLARGMFKKTLGDLVGVSGTAITKYEEGEDKPQAERLDVIARQLGFPRSFFTARAWEEDLQPVFWRSRSTETRTARDMTEQRMRWLCEVFHFLEQEVEFPSLKLPDIDLPEDFRSLTQEDIERAAETMRDAWRLRSHPIPDVTLALENAGIPVVNLDFMSDKQDGFCFRSPTLGRPFVGINIHKVSAARARFDAAHELGHVVLHRSATPQQERDPATHKLLESQAHAFAAAFLFPKESFLAEVSTPSLDYFAALKKKWGMSVGAMIFRAWTLGVIDEGEKAGLQQNMGRRRWRGPLREPFDGLDQMPLEHPRMLRRGIEAVLADGILDRRAVVELLCLPRNEIERLTGLEPGFLSTAEVEELPLPMKRRAADGVDLAGGTVVTFPGTHRRV